MEKFDIIIYGASGYTGKRTLKVLIEILEKENSKFTWAIAGRSISRLQNAVNELQEKTGKMLETSIISADSNDEKSLKKMALAAKLIINCSGPYKMHGGPVVKACIEAKCNYIDVSAEAIFFAEMELLYDEQAKRNNTYVVLACGYNSIACDMGLAYLKKNFNGTLNSVECYLLAIKEKKSSDKISVCTSTSWISLVTQWANDKELKTLHSRICTRDKPRLQPAMKITSLPHKEKSEDIWAIPYPSSDKSVMETSQRYFYEKQNSRPIQIRNYLAAKELHSIIAVYIIGLFWIFLAKFKATANLMLNYPKAFHFGIYTEESDKMQTQNLQLTTILKGKGWKNKGVDCDFIERENCSAVAIVEGYDAYELTGVCVVVSALTLLTESRKLPKEGGVYMPAPIFENTSIVEMLNKYGLTFGIKNKSIDY